MIPDDVEESEEYRDDDFESSDNSAAIAKVTVSASGKLPPLSGSYPFGATEKSLSQSFQQSKDEKRLSSSQKKDKSEISQSLGHNSGLERTSQDKSTGGLQALLQQNSQRGKTSTNRNNSAAKMGSGGGKSNIVAIDDSIQSLVDFDLSESKFTMGAFDHMNRDPSPAPAEKLNASKQGSATSKDTMPSAIKPDP